MLQILKISIGRWDYVSCNQALCDNVQDIEDWHSIEKNLKLTKILRSHVRWQLHGKGNLHYQFGRSILLATKSSEIEPVRQEIVDIVQNYD